MVSPSMPPQWNSDDDLLAALEAALSLTAPDNRDLVEAGVAAFTWRRVDEELALATLVYDSALDRELAGRVRSRGGTRILAFRGEGVGVEIELTAEGIVGQLTPDGDQEVQGQITGESPQGTFDRAYVDELGCFVLKSPPPGPVRLHCRTAEAGVVTDWVALHPR
jgi:hypothetical protein